METATTAPTMPTSTTPPDTMLSRKFLSDGVSDAASATSGITSAAATAAAVSPATALSFADADADARTTAILAAGLALSCRGWNDDAGVLASPATDDSGAATADRDAVATA